MKIDIWHNVLWSRYKGAVFSELARVGMAQGDQIKFFQIAKTEKQRENLAEVDLHYHTYLYDLIFDRSYDAIPKINLFWELTKRVWRSNAELIVLAGYDKAEYWAQMITAVFLGKNIGVFCDSTRFDRRQSLLKSFFKRFFFSHCDLVFCYGERASDYVRSFGVPSHKIVQRVQAAALESDYSAEGALNDRTMQVASNKTPRYLYIGRLSAEKNIDILLQAFDRVWEKYPQSKLIIVGNGTQRASLEAQAHSQKSRESVEFTGAKSGTALFDEYKRATCLILPSRSEPWGLVVNEALSYGCPVLVSDRCGCVPELVLEGKTGFTVRCGDVTDLAEKMEKMLQPIFATQEFFKFCISLISHYSPGAAAQQLLDGCHRIANSPRREFVAHAPSLDL
jgi:glycosyltransferase involved in cell wall biosynthesis